MAQEFQDKDTWTIDTRPYERILIYNTGGDINVTGTNGSEMVLEVTRTLKSKTRDKLETAKQSIYLDTMIVGGNLYFYVENPYRILEIHEVGGKAWYNSREQSKWRWSESGKKDNDFEFTFNVRVPYEMDLTVDTHKKDVRIDGVKSRLRAGNHYGHIYLKDVTDLEVAETHHGSVYVAFSNNPTVDGYYKTHHGEIKLEFPQTPSADISLDSHHGSFYTDFDWLPQPILTTKKSSEKGTKYKVGGNTNVRMGSGAHKISMSTHHGDLYLLKK